jgi:hypothetical protein
MVDLFSGLEGASAAMRDRGWEILTVDIDASFRPSVVADVSHLPLRASLRPDLLWASPPCEEFAKTSMPWHRPAPEPSLALVKATVRAIETLEPQWWVVENVRGAVPWLRPFLGSHLTRLGPIYLWGHLPPLLLASPVHVRKERLSSTASARRAFIPYDVSEAVAVAVEGARASLEGIRA